MNAMDAFLFGLFGLIVGSFLNVVILRRGVRPLSGRSSCTRCGDPIRWFDLVPLFSWLALRGRCRACGSRISAQYPIVEAVTSILFALAGGAGISLAALLFVLPIIAILIAIAVYDLRHTIIPDEWVWAFGALALAPNILMPPYYPLTLQDAGYIVALGFAAAAPLFLLWLVSSGRWMGLGDAKLALGIGWLLGEEGLIAVFGAFVLGTLVLVPFMLIERAVTHRAGYSSAARGLTMKSEVPFGPFLVASTLVVLFSGMYGIDIAAILL